MQDLAPLLTKEGWQFQRLLLKLTGWFSRGGELSVIEPEFVVQNTENHPVAEAATPLLRKEGTFRNCLRPTRFVKLNPNVGTR